MKFSAKNEPLEIELEVNTLSSTITSVTSGGVVSLPPTAALLLELLFEHIGEVVTYEEISKQVFVAHSRSAGTDAKGNAHIRKARSNIKKAFKSLELTDPVNTKTREGYYINSDWHTLAPLVNPMCDHFRAIADLRDLTLEIADAAEFTQSEDGIISAQLDQSIIDLQYARFQKLNQHLQTCVAPRFPESLRVLFERSLAAFGGYVIFNQLSQGQALDEHGQRANFRVAINTAATSLSAVIGDH